MVPMTSSSVAPQVRHHRLNLFTRMSHAHFVPARRLQNARVSWVPCASGHPGAKDPAAVRKIDDARWSTPCRSGDPRLACRVLQGRMKGAHMIKITNVLVATDFSDTSES